VPLETLIKQVLRSVADNKNPVLALAFGGLIVAPVVGGSLRIMTT
jgi:hypothetical protein